MLTLYFSGTGNSKFAAQLFADSMECACHSILDDVDFSGLLQATNAVAFVYPVYMSRYPRVMGEFVKAHRADLQGESWCL